MAPAPCLDTQRQIARREIAVLKEVMDNDPWDMDEASVYIRSGWKQMALKYLNRPQLELCANELETLQRALVG